MSQVVSTSLTKSLSCVIIIQVAPHFLLATRPHIFLGIPFSLFDAIDVLSGVFLTDLSFCILAWCLVHWHFMMFDFLYISLIPVSEPNTSYITNLSLQVSYDNIRNYFHNFWACGRVRMCVCKLYVPMYDVRHGNQIICTRYLAIKRLSLYRYTVMVISSTTRGFRTSI